MEQQQLVDRLLGMVDWDAFRLYYSPRPLTRKISYLLTTFHILFDDSYDISIILDNDFINSFKALDTLIWNVKSYNHRSPLSFNLILAKNYLLKYQLSDHDTSNDRVSDPFHALLSAIVERYSKNRKSPTMRISQQKTNQQLKPISQQIVKQSTKRTSETPQSIRKLARNYKEGVGHYTSSRSNRSSRHIKPRSGSPNINNKSPQAQIRIRNDSRQGNDSQHIAKRPYSPPPVLQSINTKGSPQRVTDEYEIIRMLLGSQSQKESILDTLEPNVYVPVKIGDRIEFRSNNLNKGEPNVSFTHKAEKLPAYLFINRDQIPKEKLILKTTVIPQESLLYRTAMSRTISPPQAKVQTTQQKGSVQVSQQKTANQSQINQKNPQQQSNPSEMGKRQMTSPQTSKPQTSRAQDTSLTNKPKVETQVQPSSKARSNRKDEQIKSSETFSLEKRKVESVKKDIVQEKGESVKVPKEQKSADKKITITKQPEKDTKISSDRDSLKTQNSTQKLIEPQNKVAERDNVWQSKPESHQKTSNSHSNNSTEAIDKSTNSRLSTISQHTYQSHKFGQKERLSNTLPQQTKIDNTDPQILGERQETQSQTGLQEHKPKKIENDSSSSGSGSDEEPSAQKKLSMLKQEKYRKDPNDPQIESFSSFTQAWLDQRFASNDSRKNSVVESRRGSILMDPLLFQANDKRRRSSFRSFIKPKKSTIILEEDKVDIPEQIIYEGGLIEIPNESESDSDSSAHSSDLDSDDDLVQPSGPDQFIIQVVNQETNEVTEQSFTREEYRVALKTIEHNIDLDSEDVSVTQKRRITRLSVKPTNVTSGSLQRLNSGGFQHSNSGVFQRMNSGGGRQSQSYGMTSSLHQSQAWGQTSQFQQDERRMSDSDYEIVTDTRKSSMKPEPLQSQHQNIIMEEDEEEQDVVKPLSLIPLPTIAFTPSVCDATPKRQLSAKIIAIHAQLNAILFGPPKINVIRNEEPEEGHIVAETLYGRTTVPRTPRLKQPFRTIKEELDEDDTVRSVAKSIFNKNPHW